MVVFKFGGASINSIDRIQKTAKIIQNQLKAVPDKPVLLVISAMGKTTNALEKVAESFFAGRKEEALLLFEEIRQTHLATASQLIQQEFTGCQTQLGDIFTEAEWLLHDRPVRSYDYYYDQIVCTGELMSTVIIHHYLQELRLPTKWLDVRDIIRTDDNFRDANIDWAFTERAAVSLQWSAVSRQESQILITQGFVGATADNESTTLGREGSDYTAAIFANVLNAESVTIWKDVTSVMNADPKLFPAAQPIAELNYDEIIEMAYYGAQVIHPKTIKPLYQKKIPLYVKCFLDETLPGTIIHNRPVHGLPPIIVYKLNQVLLQFSSKDFSFTGETPVGKLYHLFEELSIRPTLTQNGAISFWCCMDSREDKIEKLALAAEELFNVSAEKGLTLLTIRHYQQPLVDELSAGKDTVLTQQSKDTVQVLMR
jgi:aspartate kinase